MVRPQDPQMEEEQGAPEGQEMVCLRRRQFQIGSSNTMSDSNQIGNLQNLSALSGECRSWIYGRNILKD